MSRILIPRQNASLPLLSTVAGAIVLVLVILCAPLSAQASNSINQFDAPLLGTTATAQATRLPFASQIKCSDAQCSTGIFEEVSGGIVEYSTRYIMRDSSYTQVKEFKRGVMSSWADESVPAGSYASANFTIAEMLPGSDMVAVAQDIASLVDITLKETTVNNTTVWAGESNTNDADNIYSGSSFKTSFVLGNDSFIRAACQYDERAAADTHCTLQGLSQLVVSISEKKPSEKLYRESSIISALPTDFPADMRPLVITSVASKAAWAPLGASDQLIKELATSRTGMAQFSLSGAARVRVPVAFTHIASSEAVRDYVSAQCESTETRYCFTESLPNNVGYVSAYFDKGTDFGRAVVEYVGYGNNNLVKMLCQKRYQVTSELSQDDFSLCTEMAIELLTNTQRSGSLSTETGSIEIQPSK